MSQTYFAQSPLGAGQTSGSFSLPGGGQTYLLTANRDMGAADANQAAVVTIKQLAADGTTLNTLLVTNCYGASSVDLFMIDANAGVVTLANAGPGSIQSVSVSDIGVRS